MQVFFKRWPFLRISYLSNQIDSKLVCMDSFQYLLITSDQVDLRSYQVSSNRMNTTFLVQYLYLTNSLYIKHGLYDIRECTYEKESIFFYHLLWSKFQSSIHKHYKLHFFMMWLHDYGPGFIQFSQFIDPHYVGIQIQIIKFPFLVRN